MIIVEARDYGNVVKLQSDWCCSVQSAGTTPCIACHQTLSGSGSARLGNHRIGVGLLLLLLVCVPVSSLNVPRPHPQNEGKGSGELGLNPQFSVYGVCQRDLIDYVYSYIAMLHSCGNFVM